ncbi:beta-propeller fold lactonase family protein [Schumannella sp. 10F1B-5-1]|uniref:lactonase family protein n=1 Tax=Schumannella sp. 10F1B-5-1 TaxID=2590780 RepID=UPI0011319C2C|nr:beta-propeller fold lactonase family protein [Schumannella sp. 10F1B-5-1]TPW70818.1 lactonase family protein [Schumannella sp. 10F1B-5-1]
MSATLLVGGYGPDMGGSARGVSRIRIDERGALALDGLVLEMPSPSWLALGELGRSGSSTSAPDAPDVALAPLYAALEHADAVATAVAPSSTADGAPARLVARTATGSAAPCHLSVADDAVWVASYTGGTASRHRLENGMATTYDLVVAFDGSGPRPEQDAAHAHTTLGFADDSRLIADLGSDRVVRIADAGEELDALAFPPGTGPRDLLPLHDGTVLVLGELDGTAHRIQIAPALALLESVALPGAVEGDHAAGLALDRRSGVVHVGLRGSNRIARVRVAVAETEADRPRGRARLTALDSIPSTGDWPRHLLVVDDLLLVADQLSSSVSAYALDPTGHAAPTPRGSIAVPSPTHLLRVDDTPWATVATRP